MKTNLLLSLAIYFFLGSPMIAQEPSLIQPKGYVSVSLKGQLGNQMFQIAAGYAYAKRFGYEFSVPDLQRTHYGILENKKRFFPSISTKMVRFATVHKEIDFATYTPIPNPPFSAAQNHHLISDFLLGKKKSYDINLPSLLLSGYFQSERYFEDYREEILHLFTPPAEEWIHLTERFPVLNSPLKVGVHVRVQYDPVYDCPSVHPQFGPIYYQNACLLLPPDAIYLVFSNNIDAAKMILSDIPRNFVFFEDTDRFDDLNILIHCDHIIGSNSSFSWWGAWLGDRANRRCIFPFPWLTTRRTRSNAPDLIPLRWEVLECPEAIMNYNPASLIERNNKSFKH